YDAVEKLAGHLGTLPAVRLEGLMTMGPLTSDPEQLRPYFRETRGMYERLRQRNLPGVELTTLSMGMSDSYLVAVEEGATMIRVGTVLFGPRHSP
ncbi:MAG: alanine racemase, partial [Spirochaetota bacterium]